MGRQYNFFISPEEDLDFVKEMMDKGFLILEAQQITKDDKSVWGWKNLSENDILMENIFFQYIRRIFIKRNGAN